MSCLLDRVFLVVGSSLWYFKYIVSLPSGLQNFFEKSADNLMGVPLYVICYFSLLGFNIFHYL